MERVKGIGGVFFRAEDPERQSQWYLEHLGVPVTQAGCAVFKWREDGDPSQGQSTIWSVFPKDTEYLGEARQSFMVSYVVESLEDMLSQLRDGGVRVEEKVEDSEFGRFGWCYDPEGNRIELWEPPK
jgi:predicted enzyme related to lactoylglutathione lyase